MRERYARGRGLLAAGATVLALSTFTAACDSLRDAVGFNSDRASNVPSTADCSIPQNQIRDGGPGKDGIPALTNPTLVGAFDPGAAYIRDTDRVIGFEADGQAIAMPHNIGWWHEIANFSLSDADIAVTYCPLTGSSLAFDREAVDGAELGVSGLLYNTNLIMYDRSSLESLWPQMMREARCGPRDLTRLTMFPVIEMTWAGWRSLHPDTRVIASETGIYGAGQYQRYPYGSYESLNSRDLLFPVASPVDDRRPMKERVLGIPSTQTAHGIAFPFLALDEGGPVLAVHATVEGASVVVFWERAREAAAAFRTRVDGEPLTFVVEDEKIVDVETGSEWRIDGRAVAGPLAGERLEPIAEAYVAFWFAWAAFHPETEIWGGDA